MAADALDRESSTPTSGDALDLLVVTHRYPPYVAGGYELRTRDVVEALRARGHRVAVLTGRGRRLEGEEGVLPRLAPALDETLDFFGASDEAGNAERFRLHFFRLENWTRTLRALEETGARLLLYHNLSMLSIAPVLAARHAGVATLGDVSDPWPENHWVRAWRANVTSGRSRGGLRLSALEGAWRGFRSLVNLGPMLVPSRFLRDQFVDDGLSADDIQVLPTGLPRDVVAEVGGSPASGSPAEACDPQRPLRVLSTSALWEGKGVHVVVEAAARCVEAGVPIEVVIAGSGDEDYVAQLEQRAQQPDLTGRVRLVGKLERSAVAAELARSDVFVFPSLWGEPYARAPMEAMLRGIPVVASDAGATPELVRHDVDGWLVPAGDVSALSSAFARLAEDGALRRRLGEGGRERALAVCDFERYVDGVEAACRRAVKRGPA